VLAAVDFNDESPVEPYEVDHINPDRSLATKRNAVIAKRPEQPPHLALGAGLITAQTFRGRACAWIDIAVRHFEMVSTTSG